MDQFETAFTWATSIGLIGLGTVWWREYYRAQRLGPYLLWGAVGAFSLLSLLNMQYRAGIRDQEIADLQLNIEQMKAEGVVIHEMMNSDDSLFRQFPKLREQFERWLKIRDKYTDFPYIKGQPFGDRTLLLLMVIAGAGAFLLLVPPPQSKTPLDAGGDGSAEEHGHE